MNKFNVLENIITKRFTFNEISETLIGCGFEYISSEGKEYFDECVQDSRLIAALNNSDGEKHIKIDFTVVCEHNQEEEDIMQTYIEISDIEFDFDIECDFNE